MPTHEYKSHLQSDASERCCLQDKNLIKVTVVSKILVFSDHFRHLNSASEQLPGIKLTVGVRVSPSPVSRVAISHADALPTPSMSMTSLLRCL